MHWIDGDAYDALRRSGAFATDAETPVGFVRATEPIAAGQPIWVHATGAAVAVDHVSGVAVRGAQIGETLKYRTEGFIDLDDWTGIAGQSVLEPGARYFLHPGGQLRAYPATDVVAEIGEAHGLRRLNVRIGLFVRL